MELILIGDSKLKIMLSDKDMEKYAIDIDTVNYNGSESHRGFWSILDDVKRQTGFDTAGAKISVQIFRGKSGGCEMFISKINGTPSMPATLEIREKFGDVVFSFSEIDPLLKVLSILKHRGYKEKSSVYYDTENYHLTLETLNGTEFINEFAQRQKNKDYIYHILEHCERICINNAVETLSPLY